MVRTLSFSFSLRAFAKDLGGLVCCEAVTPHFVYRLVAITHDSGLEPYPTYYKVPTITTFCHALPSFFPFTRDGAFRNTCVSTFLAFTILREREREIVTSKLYLNYFISKLFFNCFIKIINYLII